MIQENRRYADDMTDTFLAEKKLDEVSFDHKFTISVPKAENYFPVMRYKCSNELRPVPIVSVDSFGFLPMHNSVSHSFSIKACPNQNEDEWWALSSCSANKLKSSQRR